MKIIGLVIYLILLIIAIILIALVNDIEKLSYWLQIHQYVDCVMSPKGDEMLCKLVTVTDPPYHP